MTDGPQYPQYPGEQPASNQPPPPPAGYNPPPAPGAYPPPAYGQPSYGQPGAPAAPGDHPSQLAGWGSRLGAYLLDSIIGAVAYLPLVLVGGVILGATATSTVDENGFTTTTGENPLGYVFIGLGYAAGIAFAIWNLVIRQGNTGQSLGKSIVNIKVVRENGEPRLGKGLALGRVLLFSILTTVTCYLNALWPLWDSKNQALHDKVVSTLVVKA